MSLLMSPGLALLEVEFRSGEIYRYFDVPQRTYHQLLQAESKGAYLNLNIRKSFSFKRITQTSSATY